MNLRLLFYVPSNLKETQEVNEITNLLKGIKIPNKTEIITADKGEELKLNTLIPIAVSKRIKIKQTRKTKFLYPQLVVFSKDKAVTFYPQSYGDKSISIHGFLDGLSKGEVRCLHEVGELEGMVGGW